MTFNSYEYAISRTEEKDNRYPLECKLFKQNILNVKFWYPDNTLIFKRKILQISH